MCLVIPIYYKPIENYSRLSGAYVDSVSQTTLSLSAFSSQEEGVVVIGNAEIYTSNRQYYFGRVIPTEENVYKVMVDTDAEVLLVESASSEGIILHLYVNGEYVDVYQMLEHYVA